MKTKILLLLTLFSCGIALAQTKVADKFFDRFAYIKASELYKEAIKKGDSSLHVLTRLGDCYYNNSKAEEASQWFALALDKYDDVEAQYVFKYIQTLRSQGQYDAAEKWIEIYNDTQQGDDKLDLAGINVFEDLSSTKGVYVDIQSIDINSEFSDFGSYVKDGRFYFASSRGSGLETKLYEWNKEPFLDIYEAQITESQSGTDFKNVSALSSSKINTSYHEATLCISNDGQTLYFTRDNLIKGKRLDYDKKGVTNLKLYKATLENGKWQNVEELPFNGDLYSTGHPALSPDNQRLYFVSDREGGKGQTDIYMVLINEDGTYGEPKAVGHGINTPGREMFPYVDADNIMYFSSDGHINLGFLDIFKVDLNDPDARPVNLGAPYNSGDDDFAFFPYKEGKGFFSSNRPGGQGSDDIYEFNAYQCMEFVRGTVINQETGKPVAGAMVELINKAGKVVQTVTADQDGLYSLDLNCKELYKIKGSKADFKDTLVDFQTTDVHENINILDLELIPLIKDDQIVINPIFFDFDKWNIRPDAKYELEHIVDVLRNHPTMVIKIESHTDSRGSKRYNQKLSDRRAKSTMDYILSRGIEPNRIESAIGYGESQLLNECSDGVKCTKEQHQENRRSYFYILKE